MKVFYIKKLIHGNFEKQINVFKSKKRSKLALMKAIIREFEVFKKI